MDNIKGVINLIIVVNLIINHIRIKIKTKNYQNNIRQIYSSIKSIINLVKKLKYI